MTSTYLANEKAKKQAQENAGRLWKEWHELEQKELVSDAAGNLYWKY